MVATVLVLCGCGASQAPRVRRSYETLQVVSHEDDYLVLNHRGTPITENELARRYRTTTGFTDLDDVERNRHKALAISTGASLPATIALLGFGIGLESQPPELDNNTPVSPGTIAIAFGAVGTAVLLVAFATALANPDGSPNSHDLSRRQAEYFVGIYNDRLRDDDASPAP